MASTDMQLWDPLETYMLMKVNILVLDNMVTIEHMRNQMMTTVMMLLMDKCMVEWLKFLSQC
jgi:hypothetical protein